MARDNAAVRAFCSTSCEMLVKLSQELETLKKDLDDDFDKSDLEVFAEALVSNFSDLQAGLYASRLFVSRLRVLGNPKVANLMTEVENLQSEGLRVLTLFALAGNQATKADFDKGISMLDTVISKVNTAIKNSNRHRGPHST